MINLFNEHIKSFLDHDSGFDKDDIQLIKDKYKTEITDDLSKGHITTNIGLVSGNLLGVNPREIAEKIKKYLVELKEVADVEVAGPGFLNIFLNRSYFAAVVNESSKLNNKFGHSDHGYKKSIQIEFVSANPTGPLHVGHGRGAAFGDAIGKILQANGYSVSKEYYINDAGRQIDILAASVWLRLHNCFDENSFPESGYKGKYIIDIANQIDPNAKIDSSKVKNITSGLPEDAEEQIDALIKIFKEEDISLWEQIKKVSLDTVLKSIEEDLKAFKVDFDNWYYESSLGSLQDSGSKISQAIDQLKTSGLAYEEKGAIWLNTEKAGDDKNRVLIRDDGRPTYFAADLAYHKDKVDRGFDRLINVWGSDHHGYIKRIEASLEGLGFSKNKLHVQLVQFANLYQGKEKVKMSTRSGSFYTLKDLIKEIGVDAARFYYLSKQADQHLDFDIELAKSQNKENLIFYIQYAHARIASLQNKYLESNKELPENLDTIKDGSYLACDKLIHEASKFPGVVKRSGETLQPHLIVFYLRDIAHLLHSYYNNNPILKESKENQESILQSLGLVKLVISNGLNLLGIEALEKM
jgi:arginyl-tRNA synthetase|tara:strand:- start:16671 stop:18413 length:1743 start_codon:yes stop_codon:yes gene_type:complete